MQISELNARISSINNESKRVNSNRQIMIGKKETLTNQLVNALNQYKEKYGVELTVECIETEIERVSRLKEMEVSCIENVLVCIRDGRYDDAEKAIKAFNGEEEQEEEVSEVSQTTQETPKEVVQSEPTQSILENNGVLQSKTNGVVETSHISHSIPNLTTQKPVTRPSEDYFNEDAPAPPPVIGKPPKFEPKKPVSSFNAILGGSAFNPQN